MHHPSYTYIKKLIVGTNQSLPLNIVDYGCGNGLLIELLGNKMIGTYLGLEVSDNALIEAKNKYGMLKHYRFEKINADKLPNLGKSNSVDQIVLIGVLQYLSEKEIAHVLTEATRVLKDQGQIVISCAVDHPLYKFMNLYQFFLPNRYIKRKRLLKLAHLAGFHPTIATEKGLLFTPFVSHVVALFFDAADRVLLQKKGKIGPLGSLIRNLTLPFTWMEYKIPLDYGYTLFLVLKKNL